MSKFFASDAEIGEIVVPFHFQYSFCSLPKWGRGRKNGDGGKKRRREKAEGGAPAITAGVFSFHPPIS